MKGWIRRQIIPRSELARKDDFVHLFKSEEFTLRLLAILLMGDAKAAKVCLGRALQDCIASSSVSKDWIFPWARRSVIRCAIQLAPVPRGDLPFGPDLSANRDRLTTPLDAPFDEIFGLPELDRFVFVLCVLEHCSVQDCALLLNKPPRLISDALNRIGCRHDLFKASTVTSFQTGRPDFQEGEI